MQQIFCHQRTYLNVLQESLAFMGNATSYITPVFPTCTELQCCTSMLQLTLPALLPILALAFKEWTAAAAAAAGTAPLHLLIR